MLCAVRLPLVGLSAAGYRSEGGFNGPGEPANQWTTWERVGVPPPRREPGAPGVWADPGRLLDDAAAAGAQVLALPVEWARTEPSPGRVDERAIERYAATFASVGARGIEPVAVLHDVAHPGWLGEEFWLTPGSPDRFADHVGRTVRALSPVCRRWVTLRQPNLVALAGWVDGRHPPRRVGALADAWAVVDNLLAAHLLAFGVVRDVLPGAQVMLGLRASSSYDWHRLFVDLLCAPALGVERDVVDGWVAGRRARHDRARAPADLEELAWRRVAAATAPFGAGRLRRPSPRRALDLAYGPPPYVRRHARPPAAPGDPGANGSAPPADRSYPLDALLVGWQPPHLAAALRPASRRVAPWDVVPDPEELARWCIDQAEATPGLELWVADGLATKRGAPRSDGWDLAAYVRAELETLEGAAARGPVRVGGYLCDVSGGDGDPTWPDAQFGPGGATRGFGDLWSDRDPASASGPGTSGGRA